MGSLNVAEWTPDQVADWMSGLEPVVANYVPALRARGLDGAKLLTLRCDDLEYLGIHIIGHQELLLEAVEHLRNFQYEVTRECVQQLALRVSVVATTLARALRHHTDTRLETQTLADVARTVHAVKPLVCWLDRWPLCAWGSSLSERKAALLKLSLEAATCAQRERFAEQPARAVAAAAASAAATADYIIQEVSDPMILQPASLECVTLRQRGKALGFDIVPSFCGHHQLANIRFGSPAHASGQVHIGDEIVQVNGQCVVGWGGAAVRAACGAPELCLRLRRRAQRPPPALPAPRARRAARPSLTAVPLGSVPAESAAESATEAADSSDSEALSPPASPDHLQLDHTRMYPPKPRSLVQRRHTISGSSPSYKRPGHAIEQLWQQLQQERGAAGGSHRASPAPDDVALYARDKAVSCSTGLELSPRPRTCLGMSRIPDSPSPCPSPAAPPPPPPAAPCPAAPLPPAAPRTPRGRLDKSHSTPAYEDPPAALSPPDTIPESPTTTTAAYLDKAVEVRKSPQVSAWERAEAKERVLETINIAMMEHRRRSGISLQLPSGGSTPEHCEVPPRWGHRAPPPPPRTPTVSPPSPAPPSPSPPAAVLRALPRDSPARPSPLKPVRPGDHPHISLPLRQMAGVAALNASPPSPPAGPPSPPTGPPIVMGAEVRAPAQRGLFVSSKTRSLKKKSSILAKRRLVPLRALCAGGAAGAVWQRVRGRGAARWARRQLLLAHNLLYAYRSPDSTKADCMIYLEGFTVSAAGEVKSRAHTFKVYHTGKVFYFACSSSDHMQAWIQLIQRATMLPSLVNTQMDISMQYSETEYSDTSSDSEDRSQSERADKSDKDSDKSAFGSLRKLTERMRSDSHDHVASTSLDRKYLRFFSRRKDKSKSPGVPIPTEHYRSYRRVPPRAPLSPAPPATPATPATPASPPSPPSPARRLPKPINYIHASNPNLLDFDKSDFVTKPALHVPPKPKPKPSESLVGLVTLEQFMLKKQAEERRQLYSNRVLMGVERQHLRSRLDNIVPEVIYGEVGTSEDDARTHGKLTSVTGKDGYEKLVWSEDKRRDDKWRDSLRRNDRVHAGARTAAPPTPDSWKSRGPGATRPSPHYPHLQCPPTFQPETYSLARPPPPD